ncbi:MAG TPA: nicotinate-nucleotide--dimethylbenzimidazole phosphoribosyltransferase [Rubrivivax sp.]|nr:nicotinate-nucleotide--dimethylbenzimidazole phosphoribosyltransferase [Burkholderiales bacterium]HNU09950.1 nicotinate-nucleotide--dimethylbenzimidazole phosphoribosyltransferase [Rubrivivax sp.]
MQPARSLVSPTSHPQLEREVVAALRRRSAVGGSLGQLEPLALRLALMQRTLAPEFVEPQLLVFAADHGVAVEGVEANDAAPTHQIVGRLLGGELPLSAFAQAQQLELNVIDCGVATDLAASDKLLTRKIAHGSRNARLTAAMSPEQCQAAMRAGMQLGYRLRGNFSIYASLGLGADFSAALVLSRLADRPLQELLSSGPEMPRAELTRLMAIGQAALLRHQEAVDPLAVVAALGGFDVAVMVGVMLVAASRRHLLVIDGMAACAALLVASRIAPAVTDYCVFCRSHGRRSLDHALNIFRASALLELDMQSMDGTGATLAWPMIRCAAALLTEVVDDQQRELDFDVDSLRGELDENPLWHLDEPPPY